MAVFEGKNNIKCYKCKEKFVPFVFTNSFSGKYAGHRYIRGEFLNDSLFFTGVHSNSSECPHCGTRNDAHVIIYKDVFIGIETNVKFAEEKVKDQKFHLYSLLKEVSEHRQELLTDSDWDRK